jgi:hypothetical protein
MTAIDLADLTTDAPVEQTDHFRVIQNEWRGRINSEDLALGPLIAVLWQALEAGMPDDATVSIKPGDCVINVQVKTQTVTTVRQAES